MERGAASGMCVGMLGEREGAGSSSVLGMAAVGRIAGLARVRGMERVRRSGRRTMLDKRWFLFEDR